MRYLKEMAPEKRTGEGEAPRSDDSLAESGSLSERDAITRVVGDRDAPSTEPSTPAFPAQPVAAVPVSVRPGMIIDNAYQVLDVLGEGGMGVVLRALDLKLEREVAIKLVRPELGEAAGWRAHFVAEARAMALVRHDNVVTVHAFGELKGTPYFVMEHIRGTNLAAMREEAGFSLSVNHVLSIIRQAAAGLDAIHQAGVVHRDLKPSNILIGEGFRVVVGDLGIARAMRGNRKSGFTVAGTPSYMAPETAVSDSVSPATDVFSLAVLTYELLTNRRPYGNIEEAEDVGGAVRGRAPAPSALNPEIPSELDEPILCALSALPSERPASAGEYASLLDAAVTASLSDPGRLTMLVADDDEDMRMLVEAMLVDRFPKAHILTAENGQDALQLACRQRPSLLVVDLEMPGLDGVALTAALRERSETRELPIIVMTGVGGAADWRKLAALGANAFLVKPFDEEQLQQAVRRLLDLIV